MKLNVINMFMMKRKVKMNDDNDSYFNCNYGNNGNNNDKDSIIHNFIIIHNKISIIMMFVIP